MSSPFAQFREKSTLRGAAGIALTWLVIAVSIYLAESVSIWFYPLALFVLANRLLALSLYGHEGVHGNLSRHQGLNDFIARYFCSFPSFSSFSRYKNKHLMHHNFLGSKGDPDLGLYKDYPMPRARFFWRISKETLNGRLIYEFLNYYSDVPDFLLGRRKALGKSALFAKGDFVQYLIFHALILGGAIWFSVLPQYFMYWVAPILVCVPYLWFIGAIQHAPFGAAVGDKYESRTVVGPRWMMAILLPVNTNYHGAHHFHPGVPQYRLREFADELDRRGELQWRQSFSEALRAILR